MCVEKKKYLQNNKVVCPSALGWSEIRTALSLTPSHIDTKCLPHTRSTQLCVPCDSTSGYFEPRGDGKFSFTTCTKVIQDFCNNNTS